MSAADTLVIGQGSAGEELIRGFGFVMPVPARTTLERQAEGGTVYYGALVVLLAVALAAAYFPARRVTRIDPATALRSE